MTDPLQRFVDAQRDTHDRAMSELRAGAKRTHWMWFIFPQIAGLGQSPTARHYALGDLAEARAYAAHPLLGPRLVEATQIVLGQAGRVDAETLFGGIDAVKLRSSMTLFEVADATLGPFGAVIDTLFAGERDPATLALIGR